MNTTRGDIPENELRKEVLTQDIECGQSITTKYFASDGELVRQDIEILVTNPPTLGIVAGEL